MIDNPKYGRPYQQNKYANDFVESDKWLEIRIVQQKEIKK